MMRGGAELMPTKACPVALTVGTRRGTLGSWTSGVQDQVGAGTQLSLWGPADTATPEGAFAIACLGHQGTAVKGTGQRGAGLRG